MKYFLPFVDNFFRHKFGNMPQKLNFAIRKPIYMYQYRTTSSGRNKRSRRRKKKKSIFKNPLLWIVLLLFISTYLVFFHNKKSGSISRFTPEVKTELKQNTVIDQQPAILERIKPYTPDCDHVRFANVPIKPSSKLNDINDVQMVHAQRNGLKRFFKTDKELFSNIEILKRKSVLFEVTENNFYQFKTLTHSQPYLIPEAIDMLNEIGYRFQKKMEAKKKNYFRYHITSLLRTEEEQIRLHHRNGNAANHSTHMYGTTIDISYKDFFNTQTNKKESNYDAVQAMTKVLIEMRQECRLLCVRERHQSCFHITVVVCQPNRAKK